jgi:hypothetical protein
MQYIIIVAIFNFKYINKLSYKLSRLPILNPRPVMAGGALLWTAFWLAIKRGTTT